MSDGLSPVVRLRESRAQHGALSLRLSELREKIAAAGGVSNAHYDDLQEYSRLRGEAAEIERVYETQVSAATEHVRAETFASHGADVAAKIGDVALLHPAPAPVRGTSQLCVLCEESRLGVRHSCGRHLPEWLRDGVPVFSDPRTLFAVHFVLEGVRFGEVRGECARERELGCGGVFDLLSAVQGTWDVRVSPRTYPGNALPS